MYLCYYCQKKLKLKHKMERIPPFYFIRRYCDKCYKKLQTITKPIDQYVDQYNRLEHYYKTRKLYYIGKLQELDQEIKEAMKK